MTARTSAHADFTSAAAHHRYTGVLADLFPLLHAELSEHPNRISWRVLRSGALVSLRRDGRRVLRIARRERPKTAAGPSKWEAELATFAKHLNVEHWRRVDDTLANGVAVEFHEPAGREPGEDNEP